MGHYGKWKRVSAQNFSTLWRVMYFAIIPSVRPAVTCSSCHGAKLIDAEVFTNKVTYPDGKPPKWVKDTKGISPSDWEVWKSVREQVRVVCKACDGKGHVKNECRCRGRGEILDKKNLSCRACRFIKMPKMQGKRLPTSQRYRDF